MAKIDLIDEDTIVKTHPSGTKNTSGESHQSRNTYTNGVRYSPYYVPNRPSASQSGTSGLGGSGGSGGDDGDKPKRPNDPDLSNNFFQLFMSDREVGIALRDILHRLRQDGHIRDGEVLSLATFKEKVSQMFVPSM